MTSYRFFGSFGRSLFYLPARQVVCLSVCVCVCAYLYRMIESWPTATFSINFNASRDQTAVVPTMWL